MSLESTLDNSHGTPSRARRVFCRRWIISGVILLFLVGAFLVWGPIGFGSGPLIVYVPSGGQIVGPRDQAWGTEVGIQAGKSGAVVDHVTVVGGGGYPGPRVLGIFVTRVRGAQCGGPFRWESPKRLLRDCNISSMHRLVGLRLPGNNPGVYM